MDTRFRGNAEYIVDQLRIMVDRKWDDESCVQFVESVIAAIVKREIFEHHLVNDPTVIGSIQ